MRIIRLLTSLLGTMAVVSCTATVVAQCVGVGVLWSRGVLTQEKMVRFAGVVYGLNPLQLEPGTAEDRPEAQGQSPEKLLEERVRQTPLIAARQSAIKKRTDDIRNVVLRLRISRERQELAKKQFESYLQQLEEANTAAALREIQVTLESLPPAQAKNIIYDMVSTGQSDATDQVMDDVVSIIKAMPTDKIRKILGEFKSNSERELLHQILVEIGNLDERLQLSGTQP